MRGLIFTLRAFFSTYIFLDAPGLTEAVNGAEALHSRRNLACTSISKTSQHDWSSDIFPFPPSLPKRHLQILSTKDCPQIASGNPLRTETHRGRQSAVRPSWPLPRSDSPQQPRSDFLHPSTHPQHICAPLTPLRLTTLFCNCRTLISPIHTGSRITLSLSLLPSFPFLPSHRPFPFPPCPCYCCCCCCWSLVIFAFSSTPRAKQAAQG